MLVLCRFWKEICVVDLLYLQYVNDDIKGIEKSHQNYGILKIQNYGLLKIIRIEIF